MELSKSDGLNVLTCSPRSPSWGLAPAFCALRVDPLRGLNPHPGSMEASPALQNRADDQSSLRRTRSNTVSDLVRRSDPGAEHLTSTLRVDLPCDYTLPSTTVRILADIIVATMQSRDRPSEVA